MRNSLIESLVIGCGIALGVVLVHTLTQGAPALIQLLGLLAAGVVLFCAQLALTLRRTRRDNQSPAQPGQPQPPAHLLRRRGRNPFIRELTHDWVGLEEHAPERDPDRPLAPDALDDELWGEPHAPVRKAAKPPAEPHKP